MEWMAAQGKMSLFNHSERLRHFYCPAMSSCRDWFPPSAMVKPHSPESKDQLRRRLDRCWRDECDIDPLILRARELRRQGRWRLARVLDQELFPIV